MSLARGRRRLLIAASLIYVVIAALAVWGAYALTPRGPPSVWGIPILSGEYAEALRDLNPDQLREAGASMRAPKRTAARVTAAGVASLYGAAWALGLAFAWVRRGYRSPDP